MIRTLVLAEKAVAKAATSAAAKPAAGAAAASKVDAPSMPTDETTMPWEGWFSSFVKDKMGAEKFEEIRRKVVYMPDDPHSLEQAPKPETKIHLTDDKESGPTAQFRFGRLIVNYVVFISSMAFCLCFLRRWSRG